MFRQSSSRNNRSKGFRIKHGLQIFLLIAVCVWLLYQVKHSHDKRQTLDESGASLSDKVEETGNDLFTLGRKDLNSRIQLVTNKPNEEREEEEDNEVKRESREEEEEEVRHEENEEEERGGGDDEVDDGDQEKPDEDAEQEEVVDGEEENENEDDKDTELDDEVLMFATDENDNGDTDSHDGESTSHGLIHDTQIIRSDIANSEQEKVSGEDVEGEFDPDKKQGESFNEPDPDKRETINVTSLQTRTEEAAIKEIELSRNSSQSRVVLREGEAVDDRYHNVTDNEEVSGVRLLWEDEAGRDAAYLDSNDQSESGNRSTLNVLQDGDSVSEGDTVVSEHQNITLSQYKHQNATLSKILDDNATLSEDWDQNKTQSEEETEKAETDSGDGETEERSESLAEGDDSSNSLTREEERDAVAVLATLPQHDGEERNAEVVSAK